MKGEIGAIPHTLVDISLASMMEMTATTISGIFLHTTLNAAVTGAVIIEKVSSWTRCGISLRRVVLTAYLEGRNLIFVCEGRGEME
jgi:hypothetical protein